MSDVVADLEKVTIEELQTYFERPIKDKGNKNFLLPARMAMSTLSALSRMRATESAQRGITVAIYREIAKNKEEFKQIIAVTMPNMIPKKLLDRPKE